VPGLILRTLGELVAFAACAFAVGSLLVTGLARLARVSVDATPSVRGAALRVLAGFGGVGYAAVVLALVHALRWWVLMLLGAAMLLAARRDLRAYAKALRRPERDRVALTGFALAGAMAIGELLAALAPPEAYDELAYHLPVARAIGSSHAAHQLLHASDIYGNLPSLGESLYAAALAIDGIALAHAVHLAVFLAFVALAAAIVRERCGARWGSLAAIALLAYPHLTYNATTAYVDAAATAFELGGLLLVLRWVARDDPLDLLSASLLLGLALSVKYTSLFTVAFSGLVVAVTVVRRRGDPRLLATSGLVVVLTCAFWYAKNLIRFGNPVWPFYLGHRNIDAHTYTVFVNGVHAFGPRTLHAFVEVPWRLAGDASVVPFLALSLVALALFARPARPLAAFSVAFATYWFWIATHQVRFLLTGVAASILAVTIALATGGRSLRTAFGVAALVAIVVVQTHLHPFSIAAARGALAAQAGSPKAKYALGLESRSAFLRRYFGCEADAVAFLDAHPALSPALMRQTALEPWFGRTVHFGKLPLDAGTRARAARALVDGGFKAALVRASESGTFATDKDASVVVQRRLRRIWHEGDCTIYRVAGAA
jgi:hypothetical protein